MIYNKKMEKYLINIRDEIPEEYNNLDFLDYIFDEDVDLMASITTRGDGKSFNTFNVLLNMANHFDYFKLFIVARHAEMRRTYAQKIQKILAKLSPKLEKELSFKNNSNYIEIFIGSKSVALISDLNESQDLKDVSEIISDYKVILYDEFLSLDAEYQFREFEKLTEIYNSINRGSNPLFTRPLTILLANPVDWSSPLLIGFDLLDKLETQPINTTRKYNTAVIQRRENKKVITTNTSRSSSYSDNKNSSSLTGQFVRAKINVLDTKQKLNYLNRVSIYASETSIALYYDDKYPNYYLSVENSERFDYSDSLSNSDNKTTMLNDTYYSEHYEYLYLKKKVFFANSYSLSVFDKNDFLRTLNIKKIINQHSLKHRELDEDVYDVKNKIAHLERIEKRF